MNILSNGRFGDAGAWRWGCRITTVAICVFILSACAEKKMIVPIVRFDGPTIVRDWMVIGPFWSASMDQPINTSWLNIEDATLNADRFAEVATQLARNNGYEARSSVVRGADMVDTYVALGVKRGRPSTDSKAVYLACVLRSDQTRIAHALLGSAQGVKVFLNGRLLHQFDRDRRCRLYDDGFEIPLQRGDNFLLVKVVSPGGVVPTVALRLEESASAAVKAVLEVSGAFLKNVVLSEKSAVEVAVPGAPAGMTWDLGIGRDQDSRSSWLRISLGKNLWYPDQAPMDPGVYCAQLTYENRTYLERFCIGDPVRLMTMLKERVRPFSSREDVSINCGVIETRIEILCRSENRRPENWDWQRKVVYELAAYDRIINALECGREPFRDVPGLHLRGFRSRIDNSVQHYRIFAPRDYQNSGEAWPLVIVLPTPLRRHMRFIESPFVAWLNVAEEMGKIAERHKVLLLWPGYRGQNTISPSEWTHFDEAIAAVKRDYNVDPRRVSVLGVCGAASMAIGAVLEWPERFAAIGALHGIFPRIENSGWDVASNGAQPYWATEPEFWRILRGTPLWILHDGAMPGHGDLQHSMRFMAEAKAAGWRPRFEKVHRSDPDSYGGIELLVSWLAEQRRAHPSQERTIKRRKNVVGPINRAFDDKFILVEGTIGSAVDNTAIRRLSAEFQAAWEKTYMVRCPTSTDMALTKDEEESCHLVLLGNAQTNEVWKNFQSSIPVRLNRGSVEIRGGKWTGQKLSIQAVFVHPKNASRRIVVIGADDVSSANFGTMDLSLDGWFDFAVWDHGKLIAADHFDGVRQ